MSHKEALPTTCSSNRHNRCGRNCSLCLYHLWRSPYTRDVIWNIAADPLTAKQRAREQRVLDDALGLRSDRGSDQSVIKVSADLTVYGFLCTSQYVPAIHELNLKREWGLANAVSSLFPEIQTHDSQHTQAYRGVSLAPLYSLPLKWSDIV